MNPESRKCDDCENYKPKEPEEPRWADCFVSQPTKGTYSNDGDLGRDDPYHSRLTWLVKGYKNDSCYVRAGFQTLPDAELFLAALPEEEK